jgi:hypothetical protein
MTLQLEYAGSFATIEMVMIFVPAGCWETPLVLCLEAQNPFHGHDHLE